MNKIIIFDTNILIKKRLLKNVKLLIDQQKKIGDVYITETVLDEFTNFNHSIMKTEVVDTLNNYSFMYNLLDVHYDIQKINSIGTSKDIKHTIKKLFEDNIIGLDTIKLDDVYRRAITKVPPFNASKSSDKGFKDTIIWLSILNYDYSNYSEVIFITDDNIFSQYKDELQKEFSEKHNKSISIFKDPLSENVVTPEKTSEKTKISEDNRMTESYSESVLEDYHKINDFRNDLDQVLNDIIYFISINYDYSQDYELRFIIHKYINIEDLELFRIHLTTLVSNNILSQKISVMDFLKPYSNRENVTEYQSIEIDSVFKLLEIISEFQKILPKYTNAFLSVINDRINNETYRLDVPSGNPIEISDDDLPF
nr:PIN domain-containing protein [Carnobacterium mobile]